MLEKVKVYKYLALPTTTVCAQGCRISLKLSLSKNPLCHSPFLSVNIIEHGWRKVQNSVFISYTPLVYNLRKKPNLTKDMVLQNSLLVWETNFHQQINWSSDDSISFNFISGWYNTVPYIESTSTNKTRKVLQYLGSCDLPASIWGHRVPLWGQTQCLCPQGHV